jgi:hypothetical protein
VGLFCVIAGRAFGFWAGLVAALALALNPMVVLFWHQVIVSTITILCLLLVIERYQYVRLNAARPRALLWGLPTLALAFALLLHHGPGRVYGGALVGYWAIGTAVRPFRDRRTGRPPDRAGLLALPTFGVLLVGVAVLLDPSNARYLTCPQELILVPQSEVVRSADQLGALLRNVPVMLTAVVPPLDLAPGRFGEYSSDVLVDFRYYLLPTSLLPLFLLGVGVCLARVRRQAHARLTLVLLAIMLLGPIFSVGSSISQVRMVYAVIPLYLCVAAGAGWLLASRQPAARVAAAGLLLALLAIQATTLGAEVDRHRAFVDELVRRWTPGSGPDALLASVGRPTSPEDNEVTTGSYRYYVEEGGVPALAAARRLKAKLAEPPGAREVVLVQLDGPVQRGDPTGPIKLVFFLRELGVSAAFFDPTTRELRGAGLSRPSYVIAANNAAGAGARRLLEADGLTVRLRELKP